MKTRFPTFLRLFLLLFAAAPVLLHAQRSVSYVDMAMRTRESAVFFTFNPVPALQADSARFAISFRVSYDYLAFMKPQEGDEVPMPDGYQYYSRVELVLEMGEADTTKKLPSQAAAQRRQPPPGASPADEPDIQLNGRFRTVWKGWAFAKDYTETQSGTTYLEGLMFITVPFTTLDYVFIFKESGRGTERTGTIRRMTVKKRAPEAYFAPVFLEAAGPDTYRLLNLMGNSEYGKDFVLAITVPAGSTYLSGLKVYTAAPAPAATPPAKGKRAQQAPVPAAPAQAVLELRADSALRMPGRRLGYPGDRKAEAATVSDPAFDLLLFTVRAGQLKNGTYQLDLLGPELKPVWNWRFLTLWRQMPRSLYSLDVSIEMMRFIVSREQLKELKTGSPAEREQRFRAFWTGKDPSPATEYNELMTEYYRRVDYAFDTFTTPQKPGFESDQGQVYIRMGPPLAIRRDFSSGSSALEIWEYPKGQEVVFRATSGFGDFERIK